MSDATKVPTDEEQAFGAVVLNCAAQAAELAELARTTALGRT